MCSTQTSWVGAGAYAGCGCAVVRNHVLHPDELGGGRSVRGVRVRCSAESCAPPRRAGWGQDTQKPSIDKPVTKKAALSNECLRKNDTSHENFSWVAGGAGVMIFLPNLLRGSVIVRRHGVPYPHTRRTFPALRYFTVSNRSSSVWPIFIDCSMRSVLSARSFPVTMSVTRRCPGRWTTL